MPTRNKCAGKLCRRALHHGKPNAMKILPIFASALLAAAAATPLAAQESIQVILNFDGPHLPEELTGIGAVWDRKVGDDGKAFYYEVGFANGAKAIAFPTTCRDKEENKNCEGLRLTAVFLKAPDGDPKEIATRVNNFNASHLATVATYSANGDAQLNMYIVGHYGIAIANLRTQLRVFEHVAAQFAQELYKSE